MNNNIEQNGRQQTGEQTAPPTDPRIRNAPQPQPAPESLRICRDFVWGICLMGQACKYRHDLEFNSMRTILRFCHDYQNRGGCERPDCTYLHTSREEENLFLTTGQIPRVLAERYASMPIPLEPAPEPPPQLMFNMNEYITQPPPPPPPLGSSGSPTAPQPVPTPVPAPGPSSVQGSNMTGQITATIGASLCNGSITSSMSGPMRSSMPGPIGPSISGVVPSSISGSSSPLAAPMHPTISVMPLSGMMPAPRPMEQGPSAAPMQIVMPYGLSSPMPTSVPPAMPSILARPPPPPPPLTAATSATRMTGAIYAAPQPIQQPMTAMYPVSPHAQLPPPQPSPVPIPYPVVYRFDPSRPPPPLPVGTQSRKRSAAPEPEAGPSKVRKSDGSVDSPCENCVQRELRNELYRQEIENLQREEEYKRLLYQKKAEEYQNGRALLRSLISPEMSDVLEELIDTHNSLPSTSTEMLPSTSSGSSGHSTVPSNLMFKLLECVLSNISQNTAEHTPAPPPIETVSRRGSSEAEMFSTLFDIIRNSGLMENRVPAVDTLNTNGLARLTNGPADIASTSNVVSVRYPEAQAVASTSRYSASLPPAHHFPPEGAAQPPAPPGFMPYLPVAPQTPSRPYYQPYPGVANSVAFTTPVAAQNQRATSSAPPAPSVNGQSYAQYLPRLPHQSHQYYPPFQ